MDPAKEQFTGIVPGIGLASFRDSDGVDRFLVLPGDDVKVTFPTAGTPPKAVSDTFTIVDFYESKMSEYDSNFVFVPIAALQRMRGMIDPQTGMASVNSIQIKLRTGPISTASATGCGRRFPPSCTPISTWRDKQGPLLSAVDMEMAVLNILLFMIIAVAGFGILAIFFMIVVEKTRDIGILKSLGAGSTGVGGIFLGYGLFLGAVGAGAGLALGLAITWNINRIRAGVEWCTGRAGVRPLDLLLLQDPHDRPSVRRCSGSSPAPWGSRWRRACCRPCGRPGCIPWRRCGMTDRPRPARASLQVRGVRKSYRSGGGRLEVLRGVDFDLEPGGFVSIIGQSGSGKSTLLHLMGLLDAPDAGEVRIGGKRIDDLPGARRDRLRNTADRDGVPGLSPPARTRRPRKRARAARGAALARRLAAGGAAARAAGPRAARALRPRRPAAPQAAAALGRRDAAGGDRAGPGGRAAGAPRRRADRQSRRGERWRNPRHALRVEPRGTAFL